VPDVVGLYRRFGVRLPELSDGWASTRCFSGRHDDRHPSARVHLRSGGFRCFACYAAGGVLDALELLGVHDRREARRLAVEYGILEPAQARRRPPRSALPGVGRAPSLTPIAEPSDDVETVPTSAAAGIGERIDYDQLPSGPDVVLDRTWTYVDATGAPVGRVRRLDLVDGTKRLWQERPDGDGWTPGLAGTTLPLYRLPDVLERARQGLRVLVVEGEKAVDALNRLGFFATTNAQGAGKWRPEHTAALTGATVLAIADCDLAGRLHAIRVSMDLLAAGVRVVGPFDPDPTRSDGFDIVDHLAGVAATVRAVYPELGDAAVRARLHDHVDMLIGHQLRTDGGELQRRLEYATFTANPAGHAFLDCAGCGRRRVHRLSHGLAFCPCGANQAAPG
jgi:hypothetical protein